MRHEPSEALLSVSELKKHFDVSFSLFGRPLRQVRAVDGISFELFRGETLSLVGESGCGKSTVGRAVAGLIKPSHGQVVLEGKRIDQLSKHQLRPHRRRIQMVFQDPFSSLDPRMRVKDILAEPIRNFKLAASSEDRDARIAAILDLVQLPADAASRFPHEFSGGQRQRIGIGRALAAEPDIIICDEAVSALDVSVKAQVVNLLQDLKRRLGLSLLFISHDLAIVDHMTDRVAVMYLGKIVELAPRDDIFAQPKHPYTQALLSAVPVPAVGARRERIILKGDVPSPANPPSGCTFHTRCPAAFARCRVETPALKPVGPGHTAACHLAD
ncbi:ABC transporter ATP-binding protein [Agrobacterium larrymoorei]|uniref:ATP-binding cassette domain-containing protein n=1 Tax=Agrobacterium larrymoorei TaxID=160699 RepID=A0AAF0HCE0_9HYPH|nr:oligopeptide/dipeptide ABC transporter ATP-binding protein [Agrobacterium larrymoorei]WHA43891.1 ATP-binding cassette domain-containing protein [Agrobacterium larrymoorei]